MDALRRAGEPEPLLEALSAGWKPALQRRALAILDQMPDSPLSASQVVPLLGESDDALARKAAEVISRRRDWVPAAAAASPKCRKIDPASRSPCSSTAMKPWLAEPSVRDLDLRPPRESRSRPPPHRMAAHRGSERRRARSALDCSR